MTQANDNAAPSDAGPVNLALGSLPPQRVLDTHLPTGIKMYGCSAADLPAYAAQERAADRARLADLLRGIAANNRADGDESRAICFEQAAHVVAGPNVLVTGRQE